MTRYALQVNLFRGVGRMACRKVMVYLFADGRRDMQSLLARRLLGARQ